MKTHPGSTLLLATTLLLTGCGPRLGSIDRQVDSLIRERQDALASTVQPRRDAGEPQKPSLEAYEMQPSTVNPKPEEFQILASGDLTAEELTDRLRAQYTQPELTRVLDLEDSFRIAMSGGREYLSAQEEYIIAAIRLLIEQHRWGPRFFADVAGNLNARPGGGGYDTTMSIINSFRASQRLPYGGDVEARAVYSLSETLRDEATNDYRQSTDIVLSASVPLLRGAGEVAREDLIQSERNLVYAARDFERFRRTYFVEIANDYFSLLASMASLENQRAQIMSLESLLEATQGLKDSGRRDQTDVDNVERSLLSAQDRLLGQLESYTLALERFKVRLGLDLDEPIEVMNLDILMDVPKVTPEDAARAARLYRLDLQNQRDGLHDSVRAVAVAADQLLPDLDLSAGVTFPTTDDQFGSFALDRTLYEAGVTFSLPLDREIERANLRQQTIRLAQAERSLRQREDDVVVSARRAARELDRARLSIKLQEKTIAITLRRIDLLEIREDSTAQQKLDARNDLLSAKNAKDEAVRNLRSNILGYLLATGQMRVTDDGLFQPIGEISLVTTEKVEEEPEVEDEVEDTAAEENDG